MKHAKTLILAAAVCLGTAGCDGTSAKQVADRANDAVAKAPAGRVENMTTQKIVKDLPLAEIKAVEFRFWVDDDCTEERTVSVTDKARIAEIVLAFTHSSRPTKAPFDPGSERAAEPMDSVNFVSKSGQTSFWIEKDQLKQMWGKEVAEVYRKYRKEAFEGSAARRPK